MTLLTIGNLHLGTTIYEAVGFVLVDEKPNHDFGLDLVGQNWELSLAQLE